MTRRFPFLARIAAAIVLLLGGTVGAPLAAQVPAQRESDAYTRYELLAPGSGRFRILYEVSATSPGATSYFNPIRKGSIATDEAVFDRMTGKPLRFEVVSGSQARAGGVRGADSTTSYIKVHLPRPVPRDGEVRIRIDKTYEDAKSYFEADGELTFTRPLGIKRNSVVLPAGYELLSCNYPSQIFTRADGRLAVSFMNVGTAEVPLMLRARKLP